MVSASARKDAIVVPGLTLRFVEATSLRPWWPPFARLHSSKSSDVVDQIDCVMTWYAFYGDALESFLFWNARGREPPAGYADKEDDDGDGGWPGGWIEHYHGSLPRRFVALTSTWLRLCPGRHLIIEAGDYNSIAISVVELEAQLRSLFERRASRG